MVAVAREVGRRGIEGDGRKRDNSEEMESRLTIDERQDEDGRNHLAEVEGRVGGVLGWRSRKRETRALTKLLDTG